MSLTDRARNDLQHFSSAICAVNDLEIDAALASNEHSQLRDVALAIGRDGDYTAFYAPFDWVNDTADVVIVGVTPGRQQAAEALKVLRRALLDGKSIDEAARLAKAGASFKGGMRSLGARLMDHFKLHELFGMSSTIELFGAASTRAHYTSALRYPF